MLLDDKLLNKNDLDRSYRNWFFFAEPSHSFDRVQSLSFCTTIQPVLRKLYPDDQEYKEALERHMQFFNTEGIIGSVVVGMTISLEEEKAQKGELPGDVITSLKTGLMGPMAGIGDTLNWGTLKPIILALSTTLALSGHLIGAFMALLYPILTYFIGARIFKLGYSLGREAIGKLLKSGVMNRIIESCGLMGLMVMGALSATYVKLPISLEFKLENTEPFVVQNMLDSIIPGLMPFLAIFGIYFYMKKKGHGTSLLILSIIILCLVLSFVGVL